MGGGLGYDAASATKLLRAAKDSAKVEALN